MTDNPFPASDADRHAIWEMLVKRDICAFVAGDWDTHFADFAPDVFFGIDGQFSDNPDSWRATFADIARYREAWRAGSAELVGRIDPKNLERALFALTTLREIEIVNDFAMARKKFDGTIPLIGAEPAVLRWQTLYFCRRIANRWRIAGFLGYLPNPMGSAVSTQGSWADNAIRGFWHNVRLLPSSYCPGLVWVIGTITRAIFLQMQGLIRSIGTTCCSRHWRNAFVSLSR